MRRFFLLLVCVLLLSVQVFADNSITGMKTDVSVNTDGSCRVTQTISVNLESLENELRFPLAPDAKKAGVAGFDTKQIVEDGVVVLLLKSNTGITGSRTFTVTYALEKPVTEENEIQTLTLPLLCAKWEYPIEHYAFTVTMPQEFEAKPGFISGYQGDVIEDYLNLHSKGLTLDGDLTTSLKDRESLDMILRLPAGYFTRSYAKWSASQAVTVIAGLLALLTLAYWYLKLRCQPLRVRSRSLPPDSAGPGDLPYLLCGGRISFNMMVCHWASLGYLSIYQDAKGNVSMKKRVDMGNERRKPDQKLFAALFSQEDRCDGASLVYKRTAAAAMQSLPRFWNRRLFSKRSGSPALMKLLSALCASLALFQGMSVLLPTMPARWLLLIASLALGGVLGLLVQDWLSGWYLRNWSKLALAAGSLALLLLFGKLGESMITTAIALVLALFTGWQTLRGGQRTAMGDQFVSQALGYRKYLSRMTEARAKALLEQDPQCFYRMLPYAQAMGLGEQLAACFDRLDLDACDWYSDAHTPPRTAREFYSRWKDSLSLLELSIKR